MAQEKITIVVPLGRDLTPNGLSVCENTVVRIQAAMQLAGDPDTIMMVAPGCDQEEMPYTMAVLMSAHLAGVPNRVVNRDDRHIWGTLGEMVWCVLYARKHFGRSGYDYKIVFVTTPRHARRVRFIRDLFVFFEDEDITTADAGDAQISLIKEVCLAYPKLLFLTLVELMGGDPATFKLPILQANRGTRPSLRMLGSILKRR